MRIIRLTIVLIPCLLLGCGFLGERKSPEKSGVTRASTSKAPFSTKEPEKFSADLELTAISDDKKTVRRYFVARDGDRWIEKYNVGGKSEFWILSDAENKLFRIDPKSKTFTQVETSKLTGRSDSLSKSITAQWIYRRSFKTFEDLGVTEGLRKYRVNSEGSKNSITYLFVDEKLNFPLRQESFEVENGIETLRFKTEFRNFSTTPENSLFELLDEFKKAD